MPENDARRKQTTLTPDGWVTVTQFYRQFRILVDHPPPRPYDYVDQLRADLRNWKFVGLSVLSVGMLALLATRFWPAAAAGAWGCARLFLLVRRKVREMRESPLRIGVVEAVGPSAALGDYFMTQARLEGGDEVAVALFPPLASTVTGWGGRAEVLFLDTPKRGYSLALGVRPIPSHPDS